MLEENHILEIYQSITDGKFFDDENYVNNLNAKCDYETGARTVWSLIHFRWL